MLRGKCESWRNPSQTGFVMIEYKTWYWWFNFGSDRILNINSNQVFMGSRTRIHRYLWLMLPNKITTKLFKKEDIGGGERGGVGRLSLCLTVTDDSGEEKGSEILSPWKPNSVISFKNTMFFTIFGPVAPPNHQPISATAQGSNACEISLCKYSRTIKWNMKPKTPKVQNNMILGRTKLQYRSFRWTHINRMLMISVFLTKFFADNQSVASWCSKPGVTTCEATRCKRRLTHTPGGVSIGRTDMTILGCWGRQKHRKYINLPFPGPLRGYKQWASVRSCTQCHSGHFPPFRDAAAGPHPGKTLPE